MKGTQLFFKLALVFGLATLCFMLTAASTAGALPIRPRVEQLLQQAERPPIPYIAARAGWNGPMQAPPEAQLPNINLLMDNATRAQALRSTILEIVIPDPRVLLGLASLIFLLRKLRERSRNQESPEREPQLQAA